MDTIDKVQLETVGIFTKDINKAKNIFEQIYNTHAIYTRYYKITEYEIICVLTNGIRYKWIDPCLNSRGCRVQKAYIDDTISIDVLNEIIYPMCHTKDIYIIDFDTFDFKVI